MKSHGKAIHDLVQALKEHKQLLQARKNLLWNIQNSFAQAIKSLNI